MWHDQGKWVTCRKFQFLFSYTTFLKLQKQYETKNLNTAFLPICQKQHPWHLTHSSWSCYISLHTYHFLECNKKCICHDNIFNIVAKIFSGKRCKKTGTIKDFWSYTHNNSNWQKSVTTKICKLQNYFCKITQIRSHYTLSHVVLTTLTTKNSKILKHNFVA